MLSKIKGFRVFAVSLVVLSTLLFQGISKAEEPVKVDSSAQTTVDSALAEAPVAAPLEEKAKEEKLNAGELILEHISDSHEWHIAGHLAVPLPIIIYDPAKGLSVFSSSHLEEGDHEGYRLEHNHILAVAADGTVDEEASAKLIDLSITKNAAALLVSVALILIIFLSVAGKYKARAGMAPKGLQSAIEPVILFVRDDIAKASIGAKYERYMPFLLTVFFFILINNLMGLIPVLPGGANVTGNIAVTMILALFTFMVTLFSANKNYWRHVFAMPGVPPWVLIILTPIELLGVFLRPFVLMVRLFANVTGGHIIILSFISLIFIFGELSPGLGLGASPLSVFFAIFMSCLELLVAFLQAYVFTLLSAIYIGSAIEEHHHEAHADGHHH